MTSTHRTTLATRIGQCLAATALIAGLAFGATPIAVAKPKLDVAAYEKCLQDFKNKNPGYDDIVYNNADRGCCERNGGLWIRRGDPANFDNSGWCVQPPEAENVPQPPAPTEPPPVLDPGQTGPSNPLIPTPRGPDSGTLG